MDCVAIVRQTRRCSIQLIRLFAACHIIGTGSCAKIIRAHLIARANYTECRPITTAPRFVDCFLQSIRLLTGSDITLHLFISNSVHLHPGLKGCSFGSKFFIVKMISALTESFIETCKHRQLLGRKLVAESRHFCFGCRAIG